MTCIIHFSVLPLTQYLVKHRRGEIFFNFNTRCSVKFCCLIDWFYLLLLELMIFQPWVKVYKPLFILYFCAKDLRCVLMANSSLYIRLFIDSMTIIMFLLTKAAWPPFCSRVYFVFSFNFSPINSYKLVIGHRPVKSMNMPPGWNLNRLPCSKGYMLLK